MGFNCEAIIQELPNISKLRICWLYQLPKTNVQGVCEGQKHFVVVVSIFAE